MINDNLKKYMLLIIKVSKLGQASSKYGEMKNIYVPN
jgi:hypothetical protein